jgi:hypothetical protein
MAMYIPSLADFGDDALPLDRLIHRNRHSHCKVQALYADPMTEPQRFRLLQAHCAKRGRRHEFVIESTDGLKCLWCGIVKATPREEIRT